MKLYRKNFSLLEFPTQGSDDGSIWTNGAFIKQFVTFQIIRVTDFFVEQIGNFKIKVSITEQFIMAQVGIHNKITINFGVGGGWI